MLVLLAAGAAAPPELRRGLQLRQNCKYFAVPSQKPALQMCHVLQKEYWEMKSGTQATKINIPSMSRHTHTHTHRVRL